MQKKILITSPFIDTFNIFFLFDKIFLFSILPPKIIIRLFTLYIRVALGHLNLYMYQRRIATFYTFSDPPDNFALPSVVILLVLSYYIVTLKKLVVT